MLVIQPADSEMVRFAVAWLEACVERNADFILQNSQNEPAGVFTCTATAGSPFSLDAFADHLRGLKKAAWANLNPTGYVAGGAAWFTGVSEGLLPSGEPLVIRITLILVSADGCWKVAHCHVSESVERQGIELES